MNNDKCDCNKKNTIYIEQLFQANINSNCVCIFNKNKEREINNTCYRCGRYGHFAYDCHESLYTNGYYIEW